MPRKTFLPIMLVLFALVAAPAMAGGGAVIKDCTDNGQIDGKYSPSDYRDALNNVPTDVDEYTDCRDRIRAAQRAAGGGKKATDAAAAAVSGPSGSGGGTAAGSDSKTSRRERAAVKRAAKRPKAVPVRVGGSVVTPGEGNGAFSAAADNEMPLPLAFALLAIVLAGTGLAASRWGGPVLARLRRR